MTDQFQARQISDVPELLALIFKSTSGRDRISLLRVSRAFFNSGAPVIWENITRVEHIFRLFPGAVTTTNNSKISVHAHHIRMGTSNPRFALYAPLVKRLEIKNASENYEITPTYWVSLFTEYQPLLPNLVDLVLAFAREKNSHDAFIWIWMFLVPSLKSIRVVPDDNGGVHHTSKLVAGSVLGQIIKYCPKLESLSLFPAYLWMAPSKIDGYAAADGLDTTFYDRVNSLQLLTQLSCTTQILSESHIHVLSSLPKLESLNIYPSPLSRVASLESTSSPPPLKHLGVHQVDWFIFEAIWTLGLSEGLISTSISFVPYENSSDSDSDSDSDNGETINDWNHKLIHCLSLLSPSIHVLDFDLGGHVWDCNDISLLQPLSALSLTSVRFTSPVRMDIAVLDGLATVLPAVSNLEFHCSTFDHRALACFAKLPALQHLALNLCCNMDNVELRTPLASTKLTTLEICSELDLGKNIHLFARYLLTLWPNLRHIIAPQILPSHAAEKALHTATVAQSLKDFMALRRKLDRLESGIVKECGLAVLYDILR